MGWMATWTWFSFRSPPNRLAALATDMSKPAEWHGRPRAREDLPLQTVVDDALGYVERAPVEGQRDHDQQQNEDLLTPAMTPHEPKQIVVEPSIIARRRRGRRLRSRGLSFPLQLRKPILHELLPLPEKLREPP